MRDQHPAAQDLERYAAGRLGGIDWLTAHAHVQGCAECGQAFAGGAARDVPPTRAEPAPAEVRPPGWAVVAGTAAVVALVAFAAGHALGAG